MVAINLLRPLAFIVAIATLCSVSYGFAPRHSISNLEGSCQGIDKDNVPDLFKLTFNLAFHKIDEFHPALLKAWKLDINESGKNFLKAIMTIDQKPNVIIDTLFEVSFSNVDGLHNNGSVLIQAFFAKTIKPLYFVTDHTNGCNIKHLAKDEIKSFSYAVVDYSPDFG